jgi:hypothetical protein
MIFISQAEPVSPSFWSGGGGAASGLGTPLGPKWGTARGEGLSRPARGSGGRRGRRIRGIRGGAAGGAGGTGPPSRPTGPSAARRLAGGILPAALLHAADATRIY